MSSSSNHSAPLPKPIPSGQALQEAFALSFATGKDIRSFYWFAPGAANAPVLGYKGADLKTGRKKLVQDDNEEFTSWIKTMTKTTDGSAFICETEHTIYIAPAAPGVLKARKIPPGARAYKDEADDDDDEDEDDAQNNNNKRRRV
jgi:hypothetical protein